VKKILLSNIISSLESGSRPKGGVSGTSGDIPSLGAEHLDDQGGFNFTNLKLIAQDFYKSLKKGRIKPNDILIVKDGATTGKVGFVNEHFPYNDAAINEHLFRVEIDKKKADPSFVFRFLSSGLGKHQILKDFRGATVGGISRGFIEKVEIPYPSIAEQKRFAAIFDKADTIRRKRRQAIQLADDFLRSVFLDMFGDPVTNKKGWGRCKFEDVLINIDSGWSPKCYDRAAKPDEWGVLKLGAVTSCQYLGKENKALPKDLEPRKVIEVKKGDLLFTRKNTYVLVAACAFVYETRPKLMLSDTIFRFNFKRNAAILPEYVWALFTHPGKRKQLQKLAGGSAGSMPNISKGRLMKQLIELPPIELQSKFKDVFYVVRSFIQNQTVTHDLSERSFWSISQRAFSGEL